MITQVLKTCFYVCGKMLRSSAVGWCFLVHHQIIIRSFDGMETLWTSGHTELHLPCLNIKHLYSNRLRKHFIWPTFMTWMPMIVQPNQNLFFWDSWKFKKNIFHLLIAPSYLLNTSTPVSYRVLKRLQSPSSKKQNIFFSNISLQESTVYFILSWNPV